MSSTTIKAWFRKNGYLVDPESAKLSSPDNTGGVIRNDTGAAVVADGTPLVRQSLGYWTYSFGDPEPGLTYTAYVEALMDGQIRRGQMTVAGGSGMRLLSAYLDPLVMPYVAGCPAPVVHQQEQQVFKDFCAQTEVWIWTGRAITVDDQVYYAFVTPANTTVLRIGSVTVDGIPWPIEPVSPSAGGLMLSCAVTGGKPLTYEVALSPTSGRTSGPGWLLDRYGPALAMGTRGRLHAMQGNPRRPYPWYAPVDAQLELLEYEHGIAEARIEALSRRRSSVRIAIPDL